LVLSVPIKEEEYAVACPTEEKSSFNGSSYKILMCFNNQPTESQTYFLSVKAGKVTRLKMVKTRQSKYWNNLEGEAGDYMLK